MTDPLIYNDARFGDRYEIFLEDDGTLSHVVRFLDFNRAEGLAYYTVEELPVTHRHEIEQLIWNHLHTQL